MHLSLLFTLPLAATTVAVAQTVPPEHHHDEPVALENIIVTATPYARSQVDLTQPTNVLAGQVLWQSQATSLGDLLAGELGVSSTYFGPGSGRPIIRGLGGDRIRVLDNGTGTLDASVISPDHAVALDPLLIERVEVVRGPASLLYGGAAVGGVINVITHRIHTDRVDAPLQGRLEGRYGSVNDERSGGLILEGGQGPLAWHFDAFHRRAGDLRIPGYAESARRRTLEDDHDHEDDHDDDHHDDDDHDEDDEIRGRVPNTGLTTKGGAFGVSYIGDRGYLGLSHSRLDSFYGLPPGLHVHHEEEEHDDHDGHQDDHEEEHHDEEVNIDLRQHRFDLQGEWRSETALVRALRVKLSHSDYRHAELEDDEIGTLYKNRGYEGRWELLHEPVGAFTGALGVQAGQQRFDAVGAEAFVPPSTTRHLALFLFEEATFDRLVWQLGARAERQSVRVDDGSRRSRRDHTASLSTGFVWTPDDTWTLAAALAHTQRAPNAQELYADGPHLGTGAYEIGNADLSREKSVGVDLTLRRRVGFVTGGLTVFAQKFDGFIFESPTGEEKDELPVYAFVQRNALVHGAEVETVWHLHETVWHNFDLTLAADLVRGRDQSRRENLPRITPFRARAALDWRGQAWTAGAGVQWVDAQRRVATYELPTDSHALLSAYVGRRFTLGNTLLDAFVRGTNLTDAEARVHGSFLKDYLPLPGRSVSAGVRLTF